MKKEAIGSSVYPDESLSFNDWVAYINATLTATIRK